MSPSKREARERLESLGATAAPPPRDEFVDQLDQRLRVGTARQTATGSGRRGVGGLRLAPLVPAFAALVLLVGGALAMLLDRDSPSAALALEDPVDVSVELPDGTAIAGRDGMVLEDGMVVRVGPEGSARVDGQRLGPGDVAEIADGSVTVHRADDAGVPEPDEPSTRSPSRDEPEAEPGQRSDGAEGPSPGEPERDGGTEPTVPDESVPEVTTEPNVPEVTAAPDPEDESEPSVPAEPSGSVELDLQLSSTGPLTVELTWSTAAEASTYVVVRAPASLDDIGLSLPPNEPAVILTETEAASARDTLSLGETVHYRVLGVDEAGDVVAASDVGSASG